MHINGSSFDDALRDLESIREVKLDEIIHTGRRRHGNWTEDHMKYVARWEQDVSRDPERYQLRFDESAPMSPPPSCISISRCEDEPAGAEAEIDAGSTADARSETEEDATTEVATSEAGSSLRVASRSRGLTS